MQNVKPRIKFIDIQHLKQKKIILSFETLENNKISTKKIIVP